MTSVQAGVSDAAIAPGAADGSWAELAQGLSCYTANLLAYLALDGGPGAVDGFVGSLRLGVRREGGTFAFSHHDRPLDVLADGARLRHRAASEPAGFLRALELEVEGRGRALVVANTGAIAWSPRLGLHPMPHWVLVDGRADGRWHVGDHFHALLPEGEQLPHHAWLTDGELLEAADGAAAGAWAADLRDELAFGARVAVPDGRWRWLSADAAAPADPAPETWTTGAEAIELLMSTLASEPVLVARVADDLWAASRHHVARLDWMVARRELDPDVAEAALAAWRNLPMAVQFAVRSAARGNPRPGVLAQALARVLETCPCSGRGGDRS